MARTPASRPLNILVVEDHADLCHSLKLYLGMLGHKVQLASSRADARAALEAGKYDLLVLDLVHTDDSGDAIFELPASFHGEVITMSAYASEVAEVRRLSPKLAALRHLQKPFSSEELDCAIQQSSSAAAAQSYTAG